MNIGTIVNISVLGQVAITKHHTLGSLNNSKFFLRVLEPGKSKIKV